MPEGGTRTQYIPLIMDDNIPVVILVVASAEAGGTGDRSWLQHVIRPLHSLGNPGPAGFVGSRTPHIPQQAPPEPVGLQGPGRYRDTETEACACVWGRGQFPTRAVPTLVLGGKAKEHE